MQIISTYWFLSGMYLHNWLIQIHAICSSTYMYMKNVNDVTGWLSQTTDIWKYFVSVPLDFEIKRVAVYTRTRCQVSVYKTTGPLVFYSYPSFFSSTLLPLLRWWLDMTTIWLTGLLTMARYDHYMVDWGVNHGSIRPLHVYGRGRDNCLGNWVFHPSKFN